MAVELLPGAALQEPPAAYLVRQVVAAGIRAHSEDSPVVGTLVAGDIPARDHKEQGHLVLVQADHFAASGYLAA